VARHLAKCPKCGGRVDFDTAVGDHLVCAGCGARLKVPASAKTHYPTESPTLTGQASAAADPLIGTTLGEFEIVELLGRGGMGAVYKARQASLDRLVAIKVLPQSLASDESFVERFDREARAAAAVRHPNIIEIHAIGEDRGYQYIAMEFIEGDTLSDILKREGRLQAGRALEIMRQVASALAEAHECGILHRDIKPSNILIDAKGRVKVADFGLAKHEGVDVSVTVSGQALGTPLYMPPEAARGERFDARSDLYSLGATFYHALAGRPPFQADTPALLIVKHLEGRVPPLQDLALDCPTALCRAIHRLLRKNPAERYESADKLLEVLARIETRLRAEESTPTQTVPTTPGTARRRPATARRRKATAPKEEPGGTPGPRGRLPWVIGGIAAALVLVVVLFLVLRPKGGQSSSVVPPPSPKPGTRNLEPGRAAATAERNAEIVLRNVQVCITRKDYTKAQGYLDRLRSDYGSTKFAAAHEADIAALQQQIDAYVKGTPKPQPPKPQPPQPGTQHPEPPPPAPPPDDDERWTEWEDLFDGRTLKGWRIAEAGYFRRHGSVEVQQGWVRVGAGGPRTGVVWLGDFPRTDYEVYLEAQRIRGRQSFCEIIFPVGEAGSLLLLGGWGGSVVGLSPVDARLGNRNVTTKTMSFVDERPYRVRLRVTAAKIEAWINAEKLVDFRIEGHRLEVEAGFQCLKPFGLSAHTTQSAFRKIRLRRLKAGGAEAKAGPWKVYTPWPFDAAEAKRRQAETAKALGVPVEQDIDLGKGVKLTLVLIPAGEFMMGNKNGQTPEELHKTYGGNLDWYQREIFTPRRTAIRKPFWLGKTETTQAQWQQVMGDKPARGKAAAQLPIDNVSWDDCQRFVEKLSGSLGRSSRLPSEAEWEWACRAGTASEFHFGEDAAGLSRYAVFEGNAGGSAHPVGRQEPNAWGLCDMLGNVWEYCQDRYSSQYEPDEEGRYVSRGGSWKCNPGRCRASSRTRAKSSYRGPATGLRIVLDIAPPANKPQPKAPVPGGAEATPKVDARYQTTMRSAEAKVTAGDFAGAAAELAKVKVEDKALAERVTRRREEVGRMAALKAKMIERVNTAKPRLTKRSLGIPGIGADLVKADDEAITAKRADGKTEAFAWKDLDADAVRRLVGYTAKSAEDHLAAGILLLNLDDAQGAEKHFAQAKEGGLAIDRYLDPLAEAAFAGALALLEETRGVGTARPQATLAAAEAALAAIEKDYAKTAWLAARVAAKAGIAEAEAEELYRQAAKLAKAKDLWALKPVIEKLKADCSNAKLLTDATRKPTFAEMAAAVAKLGKFLTVRKDGKGDFTSIQGAIDAAPANSVIEIQDSHRYNEKLWVAAEKPGLTLRGARGCWPLVTSTGAVRDFPVLLQVDARGAALEQLILAHTSPAGEHPTAVKHTQAEMRCVRLIIYASAGYPLHCGASSDLRACVVVGGKSKGTSLSVRDSFWLGSLDWTPECRFENNVIGRGQFSPSSWMQLGAARDASVRIRSSVTRTTSTTGSSRPARVASGRRTGGTSGAGTRRRCWRC